MRSPDAAPDGGSATTALVHARCAKVPHRDSQVVTFLHTATAERTESNLRVWGPISTRARSGLPTPVSGPTPETGNWSPPGGQKLETGLASQQSSSSVAQAAAGLNRSPCDRCPLCYDMRLPEPHAALLRGQVIASRAQRAFSKN